MEEWRLESSSTYTVNGKMLIGKSVTVAFKNIKDVMKMVSEMLLRSRKLDSPLLCRFWE